jgi:hypothetical protein
MYTPLTLDIIMEALCGEQRVTDRSRLITLQQIKRNASLDYNTWLGMRKAGKGQSEDGARQDLHSLLFYLERVAEWKAVVGKLQCLLVEGADQSGRARTEMAARIKASLHSKASKHQRPSNQTHPIFPSWSELATGEHRTQRATSCSYPFFSLK